MAYAQYLRLPDRRYHIGASLVHEASTVGAADSATGDSVVR